MSTVEQVRASLIERIRTLEDRRILDAMLRILGLSSAGAGVVNLSSEQKGMLQMSEDDIAHSRLLSQEELDRLDREWLGK